MAEQPFFLLFLQVKDDKKQSLRLRKKKRGDGRNEETSDCWQSDMLHY